MNIETEYQKIDEQLLKELTAGSWTVHDMQYTYQFHKSNGINVALHKKSGVIYLAGKPYRGTLLEATIKQAMGRLIVLYVESTEQHRRIAQLSRFKKALCDISLN